MYFYGNYNIIRFYFYYISIVFPGWLPETRGRILPEGSVVVTVYCGAGEVTVVETANTTYYSVHCYCAVHYKQCTVHCTLLSIWYTPYTVHCGL